MPTRRVINTMIDLVRASAWTSTAFFSQNIIFVLSVLRIGRVRERIIRVADSKRIR